MDLRLSKFDIINMLRGTSPFRLMERPLKMRLAYYVGGFEDKFVWKPLSDECWSWYSEEALLKLYNIIKIGEDNCSLKIPEGPKKAFKEGGVVPTKKKVYVSLPITGKVLRDSIIEAEKYKLYLENRGYEVVTPFDVCTEQNRPYAYNMGKCIEALLESDVIFLAPGWKDSKGCNAENMVALIYGKEIIKENTNE